VATVFKDRLLYTVPAGRSLELLEYDGETARRVAGAAFTTGTPLHFGEYRGALYFNGVDPARGIELWKYDGELVTLVSDIHPGPENSSPRFMTVFEDALYFFADDGKHGRELWRCDETSTELVADIDPRIREDGRPWGSHYFEEGYQGGIVYQDKLIFGAGSERTGYELCEWDGKRVTLLADINVGPDGSRCGNFCIFQGDLYFSARHETTADVGQYARELWKYDGEKAKLVADGGPDGMWKSVGVVGLWNDYLILVADDEKHGAEPWCYDGTKVQMISDAWPGPEGSIAVFRTTLGKQGIGEGRFPDRGLELFRLIEDSAKKETR
jgi:ELWxxDGT repeat protein